jgi:hypothetical protein
MRYSTFYWIALLSSAVFLSACGSENRQLFSKMDELQQQLDDKETELTKKQDEITKLTADLTAAKTVEPVTTDKAEPTLMPESELESKFSAAFAATASQWKTGLAQLGEITVMPEVGVAMPVEMAKPYTKVIHLIVKDAQQRESKASVTARADWKGNWEFPDVAAVQQKMQAGATTPANPNPGTTNPANPKPGTGVAQNPTKKPPKKEVRSALDAKTDKTITVDWSKARKLGRP